LDVQTELESTLEDKGGLKRSLRITVPVETVDEQINSRLQKLSHTTKINGFRPGKIPLKVIRNRFLSQVEAEVAGELIQANFYRAIMEKELKPAGNPEIDTDGAKVGNNFEFTANFEVFPEIQLADLSSLSATRNTATVTEADIDKMIANLRQQRATWDVVDRAAQADDQIKIDFEGSIDGEVFEGGTAEGADITLGSGQMIPGFEEGLLGMSADEEKTFPVTFPEDYSAENLAGKEAQFKVKAISVSEATLPELDQEFIVSLAVEEGTVEGLRNKVRENMTRELEQRLEAQTKATAFDLLLEHNTIELPETLVNSEANQLAHKAHEGHDHGDHHHHDLEPHLEEARKRVSLGLLLSEIVTVHELKADADKVRANIDRMADPFDDKEAFVNWYYSQPERLAEIENVVLENMIVDWIFNQVNVVEEESDFDSIMKAN
jgi:trigger factor